MFRHHTHLLPFDFCVEELPELGLIFVMIFFRFKMSRKIVNQLFGEPQLLRLYFSLCLVVIRYLADLIREVKSVKREPPFTWPYRHHVFPLVHHHLGQGHFAGILHDLDEQMVGLLPRLFRHCEIRSVVVQRIDLRQGGQTH